VPVPGVRTAVRAGAKEVLGRVSEQGDAPAVRIRTAPRGRHAGRQRPYGGRSRRRPITHAKKSRVGDPPFAQYLQGFERDRPGRSKTFFTKGLRMTEKSALLTALLLQVRQAARPERKPKKSFTNA
jgi:hypothetical protein